MKTLTIFTPTYNRSHTLERTYRSLCRQTCKDFEWLVVDDGSTDETYSLVQGWIDERAILVRYIYKENGGLYTGYNTAYANIQTELNVCIDSDDFMPDNAVELIVKTWRERGSENHVGIIGLDYYYGSNRPIGGRFPDTMTECFFLDLYTKRIHVGDSKLVMRTDLMQSVAPQVGFPGEKNFNPVYMLLQVCDDYPLLVLNENLCIVEYQEDGSMSRNIFRQYADSSRSFAKMRLLEMQLKRSTWINRVRSIIHYVSGCILAKDGEWLSKSPYKLITVAVAPLGWLLSVYTKYKACRLIP
ncbi:glycosyltransferase family A protein [uncultured Parabacteroides sp.]|uniref:glycosyltransferase family A protein n=1 Tax=uncultured Parabacteroides sp. TaxID=512312 RepID=UPI00262A39AF|nr:glycosyltransferase family A protein [uncultured Parabacteroides sp.]